MSFNDDLSQIHTFKNNYFQNIYAQGAGIINFESMMIVNGVKILMSDNIYQNIVAYRAIFDHRVWVAKVNMDGN